MSEEVAKPAQYKMLKEEEKQAEIAKFEKILYSNMEAVLDKRPTYPVSKFAKS